MGVVSIGKCKCQCYLNLVSFDYQITQDSNNEIRTTRSNRFLDQQSQQLNQSRRQKRSPGDSSLSRFSSTRKPTSRSSSSGNTKYLLSEFCNITTESSQAYKRRKIRRLIIKSKSMYQFDGEFKDLDTNTKNASMEVQQNSSLIRSRDQSSQNLSGMEQGRLKQYSLDKGVLKKTQSQKSQNRVRWNIPNMQQQHPQQQFF